MDIFTVLFYQPIYNLLIIFYRLFGENIGLGIILVALISRLITLPFSFKQMKLMESSREMNEKMKEVKERYKNNKEKQQEEMIKLQSEYLPAQLSGCLPMVIQFILLINIYHVISDIIVKGVASFNTVAYPFISTFAEGSSLNTSFLGIDLTQNINKFDISNPSTWLYLVLILLVGVTQFYSMRATMGKKQKTKEELKKEAEAKKSAGSDDFAEILQQSTQQTMFLFPVMITFLSANLPSGLGLYWIVQSSFAIIQQLLMKRRSLGVKSDK